jgi:hypothetical protein
MVEGWRLAMSPETASASLEQEAASEQRFGRIAGALSVAYLAVVLLLGDFWPFSRFAMFSNPGKPWQSALVRELSAEDLKKPLRDDVWEDQLPGKPFAIEYIGLDQHDLSAATRDVKGALSEVQKTRFATYFQAAAPARLVVYLARGGLRPKDRSVYVRYRPIVQIGPDGVQVAPSIPADKP